MSRIAVWLLLGVGAALGALLDANSIGTAIAAIYFSGFALFLHWIFA